ncbi:MAG: bifunctional histidine phosphatase family protein/GNAT family N-acetyltransferase [Ruminococcus sp.]|nr:bifunctional histidine phosphatase family protein/GNAT family N-acetyltransferase [Ruminococcus sp.]MCM1479348.1 bifunctional histidine phosphatase family protein/GNAT family N-acetyltransferase [Muribaculaceae bacterium]
MTKIYLVRHAEAMGNVEEFFQGRTDCEISLRGEKQLECVAEFFKDIPIEAIYSSPLKRTVATAKAVNKYRNLPIITDEGLIEINGGVWEGKPWAELPQRYPAEYDLWKNRMEDFYIEGGEKMTEVFARMKKTVDKIAVQNDGRTIAVVSHGCALRNFLCYAMGRPISSLKDVGWSDNTAVSLVEYDGGVPRIIFKNSNGHLPDELSTLSRSKWSRLNDVQYGTFGKISLRNLRKTDPEIFAREEVKQGWKDASPEKLEMRLRDNVAGKAVSIAADYEGEPAGYVSVYPYCMWGALGGRGYSEIVDIAVLEKFRRKGVGTALMDIAEKIAGEYSDTVYLGVGLHSGYGAAQRLYIKRGYVPDGSGVWCGDKVCPPHAECVNDDELNLYFYKKLR